jgi:hypothetical protein
MDRNQFTRFNVTAQQTPNIPFSRRAKMKRSKVIALLLILTAAFAGAALADVKVKSKQTVSGQSYESTTYIKGKRQRSESMGGMVNITQCDLKRGVQLNGNTKTYMVTPFATTTQTTTKAASATTDENGVVQTGGRVTTTYTIKDTGERKQMFGYTARRLIITMETVSSPDACTKADSKMQTDGWYIDAAFALDCDYGMSGYTMNYGKKGGCQDKYDMKTVGTAKRGFPVYEKMTMFDASGKESFTMINEVVEFSQATLDPSLFDIPQGYREVSDSSQMYASAAALSSSDSGSYTGNKPAQPSSALSSNISNAAKATPTAATLGPKKAGVIRIGVPVARTGTVGEGVTAQDLAAAVQNTLLQKLKAPNIEVVAIEAKVSSAIDAEAHSKECDFVVSLNTSHKKGGGGFGMFKAIAPVLSSVAPSAGATAGTGGYIVGSAASEAITATAVAGHMKSKDELTLDVKLNRTGSTLVFEKVLKAKAKSNGEDIISQVVEQAAQGIVETLSKL